MMKFVWTASNEAMGYLDARKLDGCAIEGGRLDKRSGGCLYCEYPECRWDRSIDDVAYRNEKLFDESDEE